MIDAPANEAAAEAGPAEQSSWAALGRTLLADVAGVLRERLHLVALEGQQFVHGAGRLLAFGLVAAVLALTTWFVIVAAMVALLVHLAMPLAAALLVGAILNLAGAALAWQAMRRQLATMAFPATLRSLEFAPPPGDPSSVPPTGVGPAATAPVDPAAAQRASRALSEGSGDGALRAPQP